MDVQCDTLHGQARRLHVDVASIVNIVRPMTIQFIALSVHLCKPPVAKFSKSRVWDKVPEESTLIFRGIPEFYLIRGKWKSASVREASSLHPTVSGF